MPHIATDDALVPRARRFRWPYRPGPLLLVAAAVLAWAIWLLTTPPGLLGKADAVGYAICHRIDLRSFHLGNRQLPLCARCTGTYLGALAGLAVMGVLGGRRAAALPPRALFVVLLGFIGLMGVDGVNSFLSLFAGAPTLYQPQNWLRLITGVLNGLALAGLILPSFNQTMWADAEARPALGRARDLLLMLVVGAVIVVLVLSDQVVVLYPLAVLSAVGVVVMLAAINAVVLLFVTRRENRATTWRQAALPLLAGVTLAIVQIGLVDGARYAVFGTWGGLTFPG